MKDDFTVSIKRSDSMGWLPISYYKSTFPILSQPGKTKSDIFGTAFLLDNLGVPYIVTAKHVASIDNPTFLFTRKGRKDFFINTNYLNEIGIKWNFHTELDLAAIEFSDYPKLAKKLDNYPIIRKFPKETLPLQTGLEVRHLGYPEKATGHYLDGSPANIPTGMVGKIVSIKPDKLLLHTPARYGASGGPLFAKTPNGVDLIGVITRTSIDLDRADIQKSRYTGKTTALPISFLSSIMK